MHLFHSRYLEFPEDEFHSPDSAMQITSRGSLAPIPHYFLGAPGSWSWSIPAAFNLLLLMAMSPQGSAQGQTLYLETHCQASQATSRVSRNSLKRPRARLCYQRRQKPAPGSIPWPVRRQPKDNSLSSVPIATPQSHSSSKMVSWNLKHSLACSRHLSLSMGWMFLACAWEYYH